MKSKQIHILIDAFILNILFMHLNIGEFNIINMLLHMERLILLNLNLGIGRDVFFIIIIIRLTARLRLGFMAIAGHF